MGRATEGLAIWNGEQETTWDLVHISPDEFKQIRKLRQKRRPKKQKQKGLFE